MAEGLMARDSVRGDKELAKALRALSKGPSARELDGMATRTMRPVLDDARARMKTHRNYPSKYPAFFPKQRGPMGKHMDRFLVMRKEGKQSVGKRSYRIGGINRARWLLHLVEFGTSPHAQPGLGFMHPGATPRPVMTPAYEAGHARVIHDWGYEIANWLQQDGRRYGLRIVRTR